MILRKNYVVMTLLMVLTLFLFLFTGAAKEYFGRYEQNEYAVSRDTLPDSGDAFYPGIDQLSEGEECVIYIGDPDGDIGGVVRQWASYTKRRLLCQSEIPSLTWLEAEDVELVLVDGQAVAEDAQEEALYALAEAGTSLVFCRLPDVSRIEESDILKELMGIGGIQAERTRLKGVSLLKGMLLGGEKEYPVSGEEYQDMGGQVPWYRLLAGTKIYMKGMQPEETEETEVYQPLIWYHAFGGAFVFCVNGDYLSGDEGLGILEGFAAEKNDYEIYPVVNAQNFLVLNYPTAAEENGGAMMEYYSQTLKTVEKEIAWTGIASLASWTNGGLTCMSAPRLNYNSDLEQSTEDMVYYMNLMRQQQGEMGLSGLALFGTPLADKIQEDERFLEEALPGYRFTSFYLPEAYMSDVETIIPTPPMEKVRTVVSDYTGERDVVSYLTEDVTQQMVLTDAAEYRQSDDFRMRSIASCMGYTSLKMDMKNVVYPASQEDSWEVYFQKCSDNIADNYNCYDGFEKTTATGTDERIRTFLSLDFMDERKDDEVYLNVSGTDGESWFILRTHGEEIEEVEGGSFKELEEDAYLIRVDGQKSVIRLKKAGTEYLFREEDRR